MAWRRLLHHSTGGTAVQSGRGRYVGSEHLHAQHLDDLGIGAPALGSPSRARPAVTVHNRTAAETGGEGGFQIQAAPIFVTHWRQFPHPERACHLPAMAFQVWAWK